MMTLARGRHGWLLATTNPGQKYMLDIFSVIVMFVNDWTLIINNLIG
jgi:hypothetical protein